MPGLADLSLITVERSAACFAAAIRAECSAGRGTVAVVPDDDLAASIFTLCPAVERAAPAHAEVLCLTHSDARDLDEALFAQIDRAGGTVIAGQLPGHGLDRPLFLISIPKAGTHLLYRFAEKLGFRPGIICPEFPQAGNWYCVEFSNSHTVPRDFFVDSVRRASFGNRSHPFLSSAALFLVRHPWDILVSEAQFYPQPGNAAFSDYYSGIAFPEVVARLLDDKLLLPLFRDRLLAFHPWLSFQNVIPLGFEDLVGEVGGGSHARQCRLIWSIQLKLGVPGAPAHIAAQLYDESSPTFNRGRVGGHRLLLAPPVLERLRRAEHDLLDAFGYHHDGDGHTDFYENWITRPLACRPDPFTSTPMLVESDYLGYNIVRFAGSFFGIPMAFGPMDLQRDAGRLADQPRATSLNRLRAEILLRAATARPSSDAGGTRRTLDGVDDRLKLLESLLRDNSRRLDSLERASPPVESAPGALARLKAVLGAPFRPRGRPV